MKHLLIFPQLLIFSSNFSWIFGKSPNYLPFMLNSFKNLYFLMLCFCLWLSSLNSLHLYKIVIFENVCCLCTCSLSQPVWGRTNINVESDWETPVSLGFFVVVYFIFLYTRWRYSDTYLNLGSHLNTHTAALYGKISLLISRYFIKNVLIWWMILNCITFIIHFVAVDFIISSHWKVGAQGMH